MAFSANFLDNFFNRFLFSNFYFQNFYPKSNNSGKRLANVGLKMAIYDFSEFTTILYKLCRENSEIQMKNFPPVKK